jgi:hypothetical protein
MENGPEGPFLIAIWRSGRLLRARLGLEHP